MNQPNQTTLLQQNLANSPGYFAAADAVEPKKNTQYHAAIKLMVQGKKPDSKIDHWKRHLLWAS